MSLPARSITVVFATVALSLEMFATSATASNLNLQQQSSSSNSPSTVLLSQERPVLLARNTKRKPKKSKTKKSKSRPNNVVVSPEEASQYRQLEIDGWAAAEQCILYGDGAACNRLSNIYSTLQNLCSQKPSQICSNHYTNLSGHEAYLRTIKPMLEVH
ncbi:hypothetical protein [Alkalinema sp. FACHB-956]|uniref:hypothetical protein n=1 Tax=Alkalinema sp. FACHB-956 TaxID=2692768 RepID=UPI001686C7BE|nr:hypothetical protein [Alkalinema sp. FACHB-956]MBD2326012.1 hypothetical protein [Alkalinema sp. FACHB-956]